MRKIICLLLCCCVFMLPACGTHAHSYQEANCEDAAVCSSCGEEISPALGHTTKIGACARCGKVQNEMLMTLINTDSAQIMDEGEHLISCLADLSSLDSGAQFKAFQTADDYTAKMKDLFSEMIEACSAEEELDFLVYQIKLLDHACPGRIEKSDAASLAEQTVLYQLFFQQLSSSFHYLSIEMDRLAGNTDAANKVAYFEEVPEMPTPDSVIFDITYDSRKTESGVVQYTYLLGNDATDANMNYNTYLAAVGMVESLQVSVERTYCYVIRNGAMVSAMMAGTDPSKGFFLVVSFQE